MTSKATLAKSTPPNSPLHRISTNSTNIQWDRDERGAYLIDRDPGFFQSVLNYLRHGKLILSRDLSEEGIILEAEYFHLPELAKVAKQRLIFRQHYLRTDYLSQMQLQQQQQQQLCNNPLPINNGNSVSLLFSQPDHLTNYVNSILEEGFVA